MALEEKQKDKIRELRNSNQGYRTIAAEIGATRDQVRDFCRLPSNKLNGQKAIVKLRTYQCKHCGNEFAKSVTWNHTFYCSDKCNKDAKNKKARDKRIAKITNCKGCGKEFIRNGAQAYCSAACKITIKICAYCGKEYNFIYRKGRKEQQYCSRECSGKGTRKTHEEYYKEFSDIHKGMIVPVTMYDGTDNDLTVYCLKCKTYTTRKATKYIERKAGCSTCDRKYSVGESAIQEWLESNKVNYIKQYQDDSLKAKTPLRFDFAILDNNNHIAMLIEYNGRQHYEPVKQFGGDEEFERQKNNDQLKREYAHTKEIKLIEINYKRIKEIENILSDIICMVPAHLGG